MSLSPGLHPDSQLLERESHSAETETHFWTDVVFEIFLTNGKNKRIDRIGISQTSADFQELLNSPVQIPYFGDPHRT